MSKPAKRIEMGVLLAGIDQFTMVIVSLVFWFDVIVDSLLRNHHQHYC